MSEREAALDYATEKLRDIPQWCREPKGWAPVRFKSKTTSGESHLLYRTARQLGEGNYADVGVYRGASTATLAAGLRDGGHHGTVYAVDLFGPLIGGGVTHIDVAEGCENWCGNEETPQLLRHYFDERFPEIDLEVWKGDSATIGLSLDIPFKFVFIDADHHYEGCMRDYLAWERLVTVGGMLAFHDTHLPGVNQVIEEIDPHWQLVHHIYSTKVFVRTK